MNINIVSKDERYKILESMLQNNGIDAKLCTSENIFKCKYLLLSVGNEYGDEELGEIFSKTGQKTVVLCGKDKRIGNLFKGKIIDYSSNDSFLQRNAYLTAEATVSFLHALTKDTLKDKRIFVSGYGRIGSALCYLLKSLGARVYAYARRDEVRAKIEANGVIYSALDECVNADIIVNTVPSPIYSKELTDKIGKDTHIVDLASPPFGFENMEGVVRGSALPGRILPFGAACVLYDTIISILSEAEKEYL